jgi:hypothetical protein
MTVEGVRRREAPKPGRSAVEQDGRVASFPE